LSDRRPVPSVRIIYDTQEKALEYATAAKADVTRALVKDQTPRRGSGQPHNPRARAIA
jgi:hypothetical protein